MSSQPASSSAIPGAIFRVLPVGHYAGLQKPELVAAEMDTFLNKHDI